MIVGMTGQYDQASQGFGRLHYMVCRPENDFFPDLSQASCCACSIPASIPSQLPGPCPLLVADSRPPAPALFQVC